MSVKCLVWKQPPIWKSPLNLIPPKGSRCSMPLATQAQLQTPDKSVAFVPMPFPGQYYAVAAYMTFEPAEVMLTLIQPELNSGNQIVNRW